MSTHQPPSHLHSAAFAALLAHDPAGRSKAKIASVASVTPANLREFETGLRAGTRVKGRLAEALGVAEAAVTCWCDRPDGRCRSVEVTV
jgi:hypothetical protein